jgi:hypothetical protein
LYSQRSPPPAPSRLSFIYVVLSFFTRPPHRGEYLILEILAGTPAVSLMMDVTRF